MGGQITTAANGAEAVEIVRMARKSGLDFDVIFTDIQMPEMDGLEATLQIRKDGFVGPIIAISGSEEYDVVDRSLAAGCDEFIAKPVTVEKLAAAILRHCPGQISGHALAHA